MFVYEFVSIIFSFTRIVKNQEIIGHETKIF